MRPNYVALFRTVDRAAEPQYGASVGARAIADRLAPPGRPTVERLRARLESEGALVPDAHVCPHCGRQFAAAQGLGQHVRRCAK